MSDRLSEASDTWEHVSRTGFSDGAPASAASEESAASPTDSAASALSPPETSCESERAAPPPLPESDMGSEHEVDPVAPEAPAPEPVVEAPAGDSASESSGDDQDLERATSDWNSADREMNDLRFADCSYPNVPLERVSKKANILVVGCEQTGKATTLQTMFAPLARDPAWTAPKAPQLDADSFADQFAPAEAVLSTHDNSSSMELEYRLMVAPGLTAPAADCVATITKWIQAQDDHYAAQECDPCIAPGEYDDKRVTLVLYFLPDHIRLSAFDADVMKALFAQKPGIPVMFRGDTFNERMLRELKADFQAHVDSGLTPYAPSPGVAQALYHALRGTGRSLEHTDGEPPRLKLPLNVIAGDEVDASVSPFPVIRSNGTGSVSAYSSAVSDLPALRRLVTEVGFHELLQRADASYRAAQRTRRAAAPAPAPAAAAPAPAPACHQATQASPPAPVETDLLGLAPAPPALAPLRTGTWVPTVHDAVNLNSGPPSVTSDDSASEAAPGLCGSTASSVAGPESAPFEEAEYNRIVVGTVEERGQGGTMRVTMESQEGDRLICIRVSETEGTSMRDAMNNRDLPRPAAYDTFNNLLSSCGATIQRVLIVECEHTVFYARVHVSSPRMGSFAIDARPSTAINLALRAHAPVYAKKSVMAQFGKSKQRR